MRHMSWVVLGLGFKTVFWMSTILLKACCTDDHEGPKAHQLLGRFSTGLERRFCMRVGMTYSSWGSAGGLLGPAEHNRTLCQPWAWRVAGSGGPWANFYFVHVCCYCIVSGKAGSTVCTPALPAHLFHSPYCVTVASNAMGILNQFMHKCVCTAALLLAGSGYQKTSVSSVLNIHSSI